MLPKHRKYKFSIFPVCFSLSYFLGGRTEANFTTPTRSYPLIFVLGLSSGFLTDFYHVCIVLNLLARFSSAYVECWVL